MLEIALMLPFLALLILGIADLGQVIYYTIAVNNAATAGAEYGSQNDTRAGDYAGMQSTATTDASFSAMSATATRGCTCDSGNGNSCVSPLPDPSTCDPNSSNYVSCSGGTVVECVQVTTNATITPLFGWPGLSSSYQANGNAVMRVRN